MSVPEFIATIPATEGAVMPVPGSGLSIQEIESRYIWSVQPDRTHRLDRFTKTVFKQTPNMGQMLINNECRLLQLWPHKSYLLSDNPTLPLTITSFESIMTDISHGFCELSLGGERAFDFIKLYVTVNLNSENYRDSRHLRCCLGQYSILLWWDDSKEIHILVDRSYAQSFRDFLNHLMQHHDWNIS